MTQLNSCIYTIYLFLGKKRLFGKTPQFFTKNLSWAGTIQGFSKSLSSAGLSPYCSKVEFSRLNSTFFWKFGFSRLNSTFFPTAFFHIKIGFGLFLGHFWVQPADLTFLILGFSLCVSLNRLCRLNSGTWKKIGFWAKKRLFGKNSVYTLAYCEWRAAAPGLSACRAPQETAQLSVCARQVWGSILRNFGRLVAYLCCVVSLCQ